MTTHARGPLPWFRDLLARRRRAPAPRGGMPAGLADAVCLEVDSIAWGNAIRERLGSEHLSRDIGLSR